MDSACVGDAGALVQQQRHESPLAAQVHQTSVAHLCFLKHAAVSACMF